MRRFPNSMRMCGGVSRSVLAALLLVLNTGCWVYIFHGGGLPADVMSMAILPFDNQTPNPELQQQLLDEMRKTLERRSFTYRASQPRIEQATLGNEAGLYGAAYLPWSES